MSSKLTALELEDYREVFNDFDADGSGKKKVFLSEVSPYFKLLFNQSDISLNLKFILSSSADEGLTVKKKYFFYDQVALLSKILIQIFSFGQGLWVEL